MLEVLQHIKLLVGSTIIEFFLLQVHNLRLKLRSSKTWWEVYYFLLVVSSMQYFVRLEMLLLLVLEYYITFYLYEVVSSTTDYVVELARGTKAPGVEETKLLTASPPLLLV